MGWGWFRLPGYFRHAGTRRSSDRSFGPGAGQHMHEGVRVIGVEHKPLQVDANACGFEAFWR